MRVIAIIIGFFTLSGCALLPQVVSFPAHDYPSLIGRKVVLLAPAIVGDDPQEQLRFIDPAPKESRFIADVPAGTVITIIRVSRKYHFEFGAIDYLIGSMDIPGFKDTVVLGMCLGAPCSVDRLIDPKKYIFDN